MVVIIIRTLIVFMTLVIVMRLMGKRQIGEMQPFEFVVTLIIADLACIPMADVSIPLVYGIVAILSLFILHQLFSVLEQQGVFFKRVISGKPSLVINKDGIDLKELKKNNMGVEDLIESMRALGYFSLDDLDYAVFESNGKLSAMENASRTEQPSSLPLLVVSDGKTLRRNVNILQADDKEITTFLSANGLRLNDTEVMTVDGNGRVYLKKRKEKYKILNYKLKDGIKW